jgi:hypothetical protein
VNFWNNIARSTLRELARAAGVRVSNENAVTDLTQKYGSQPTAEFVEEMWPVLRDVWLTNSASERQAIVEKMQALGRGNMKIKTKTKKGQLDYLQSLRRSPALTETVLAVFLKSGAEERIAIYIDTPKDSVAQEEKYYTTLCERFRQLDATTIESVERMTCSAVCIALNGVSLPLEDPAAAASRVKSAIMSSLLFDKAWEPENSELHDYQHVILGHIEPANLNWQTIQNMFASYEASINQSFSNQPNQKMEVLKALACALFMLILVIERNDELPEKFINMIFKGQLRFFTTSDDSEESKASKDRELGLDESITDILSRLPNSTRPEKLNDGAIRWQLFMGSAVVNIIRLPFDRSGPTCIRFITPLVHEVKHSEELSKTLNLVNAKQCFYKFYWRDDIVFLEYEFATEGGTEQLFKWQLSQFAGAADHFDTKFRDQFGGKLAREDQKAVFDA